MVKTFGNLSKPLLRFYDKFYLEQEKGIEKLSNVYNFTEQVQLNMANYY